MADLHDVEMRDIDGVVIATVRGEVERSNARDLHAVLLAGGGRPLVLDLRNVTYFDSSGVDMLEALREAGPLVLVLTPDDIIHRTIAVLGLEPLVPTRATVEQAVMATRTLAGQVVDEAPG